MYIWYGELDHKHLTGITDSRGDIVVYSTKLQTQLLQILTGSKQMSHHPCADGGQTEIKVLQVLEAEISILTSYYVQ